MAKYNKTLYLIASKLGLSEEVMVLSKADEFHRLLQMKWTTGSNISDTSKLVICLDLAAMIQGVDLDTKSAIKYSGLKPSAYTNSRKIVENLLELNSQQLTISMLCITMQCPATQDLAEKILEEYRRCAKMEVDMNLPQYVCMAVYQACRITKVKITKSKIIEKSRLKPTQWAKLDADWTKFVDDNFAAVKKTKGKIVKDVVDNAENDELMEVDNQKDHEPQQENVEPYDDWKRRMLEIARKELKELEKLEARKSVTPRKSPRKAVQKFSPYKSPSKPSGSVRLLFPIGS